jgi:hypothetical protein
MWRIAVLQRMLVMVQREELGRGWLGSSRLSILPSNDFGSDVDSASQDERVSLAGFLKETQ